MTFCAKCYAVLEESITTTSFLSTSNQVIQILCRKKWMKLHKIFISSWSDWWRFFVHIHNIKTDLASLAYVFLFYDFKFIVNCSLECVSLPLFHHCFYCYRMRTFFLLKKNHWNNTKNYRNSNNGSAISKSHRKSI